MTRVNANEVETVKDDQYIRIKKSHVILRKYTKINNIILSVAKL